MANGFETGKQPKRTDYRTLHLARYQTSLRPPPPDIHNESLIQAADWEMLGNDTVGDCTCAAAGHAEMLWRRLADEPARAPDVQGILGAYSAISGYKPGDQATDKGADLLSVLKYWRNTGIAGMKIQAFAEVAPSDEVLVKQAISLFGLAYVGLQLPCAAMPLKRAVVPFNTRRHWYDPATWQNPFNGHCVIYAGYDADGPIAVTWGTTVAVSWQFHKAYCDELYAIIPPTDLAASLDEGKLDLNQLHSDLRQIAA